MMRSLYEFRNPFNMAEENLETEFIEMNNCVFPKDGISALGAASNEREP